MKVGGSQSEVSQEKTLDPIQKITKAKKRGAGIARGMAKVVEPLPTKCEALSSNTNTTKNK
jgi:hypothetical protein